MFATSYQEFHGSIEKASRASSTQKRNRDVWLCPAAACSRHQMLIAPQACWRTRAMHDRRTVFLTNKCQTSKGVDHSWNRQSKAHSFCFSRKLNPHQSSTGVRTTDVKRHGSMLVAGLKLTASRFSLRHTKKFLRLCCSFGFTMTFASSSRTGRPDENWQHPLITVRGCRKFGILLRT